MEGALPFAWVTRDLTQSGVLGDATIATPEKGKVTGFPGEWLGEGAG
jgi:creatinine amidohydrolase/Fe(II)-dependent formamide hydrolase-like protein